MEISTHISHDHIILCLMGINFFRTCFWHVTTTNKSYFSNLIYMCIYLSLCHISVITNMMAVFVNCTQSSLHMHVCLYLIVAKPLVVWLFYDWRNLSYFILIMVNILSICEQCFWLCRNFKHKLLITHFEHHLKSFFKRHCTSHPELPIFLINQKIKTFANKISTCVLL